MTKDTVQSAAVRALGVCLLHGLLVAPAWASEGGDTPAMTRALAAGYKATFICGGTFNAGRSLDEIEANELNRFYPDYREIVEGLPDAVIDKEAGTVSVAWSNSLPPRVSVWRPVFGCTQLPMGAGAEAGEALPRFAGEGPVVPEDDTDPRIDPAAGKAPVIHDPKALERVTQAAFDGKSFGDGVATSGIVIVRDGMVIAERYDRGIDAVTSQRTWSVAKSISATVIGAATAQGLVSPEEPAGLAAWSSPGDPRGQITLANLLHMGSGLDSGVSGSRTDRLYFGGARIIDRAVPAGLEVAPGTRFKYANNDTLLAMRTLRERIGDDDAYHRFPYERVLWPIGAVRTAVEMDWNGDFLSSSQVWTTARDMARIGQLYLNDGVWDGRRILPEGWAAFVSRPAPAQPENDGWGYGAQFWLNAAGSELPADTFRAAGHRGQYIVIIPSRNTVIIRRGFDESGGVRFDIDQFTAQVLDALDP